MVFRLFRVCICLITWILRVFCYHVISIVSVTLVSERILVNSSLTHLNNVCFHLIIGVCSLLEYVKGNWIDCFFCKLKFPLSLIVKWFSKEIDAVSVNTRESFVEKEGGEKRTRRSKWKRKETFVAHTYKNTPCTRDYQTHLQTWRARNKQKKKQKTKWSLEGGSEKSKNNKTINNTLGVILHLLFNMCDKA